MLLRLPFFFVFLQNYIPRSSGKHIFETQLWAIGLQKNTFGSYVEEYHKYMEDINPLSDDIYKYLNFNEIDTYVESADSASISAVNIVNPS